ncbi:MAG: DUF4395 domain-containing protein [Betaproteobacteria bacterium]|nr:DUF4395 domain-containing protein [Betaproteobacteria bacterium]
MLRFDIPQVCGNAYRLQSAMNFTIAALYLFTPYRWVSLLLVMGGFLRGFVSPHRCLSYRLFSGITGKLGWAKMQNAGSKMFADKVAFALGTVMAASWLLGSEIGTIPAAAIVIFALLDLLTGFCAACWIYTLWYRLRSAA